MHPGELHVILGAGGNIGATVARQLAAEGKRVRGVTRSGKANLPDVVEVVQGDALDSGSLKEAVTGADVIYHCIGLPYPQWSESLPVIMRNVVDAAIAHGPDTRIVYADNLYCYGKQGALMGSLREQTPEMAEGIKGRIRAEIARDLLRTHNEGLIKATIGRGSDFFGPFATNSILDYFVFPAVLQGKKAKIMGNPDAKHSFIYLPDFARGLITLADNEKAFGKVWILPHQEPLTLREFIHRIYQAAGMNHNRRVGTVPKFILLLGSLFSKMLREVKEVAYQTQIDWVADSSQFETLFHVNPTPLDTALQETLQWYRERETEP